MENIGAPRPSNKWVWLHVQKQLARKMPVRKGSNQQRPPPSLRVAALFLRRRIDKAFHTYINLFEYNPSDYEVLLRNWPTAPFLHHLGAFSGPVITGQDPVQTLLHQSQSWTVNLATKVGVTDIPGMQGRRAVFLSVHGGGSQVDPLSGKSLEMGVVMCYVVPVTHSDSTIISQYPTSSEYPRFYELGGLLRGMVEDSLKIHPYTREMLAAIDRWLREQHMVPGAINMLFAPSLEKRMKMHIPNPLFGPPVENTPPRSPPKGTHPFLSSTPFHGAREESTLHETTVSTIAKLNETYSSLEDYRVDVIVKNPLFGSGLQFGKVNSQVVNEHFGRGTPNYKAIGDKKEKWMVQVQGDGLPDWVDMFPLHKFTCEGDVDGVRRCVRLGMSPDERDTDSWAPLHYACWYGELEVVKVLVEEASATLGVQNSSGSTPLHLAAATGHTSVVAYLLKQRDMERIMAALDIDGKSPLAVCLECRMNDWEGTAQLLREAYRNPSPGGLPLSPTLLSFPQPVPFLEDLQEEEEEAELGFRGSLGNVLEEEKKAPRKTKNKQKTVRRQRVNFMSGQHQVAHFFRGMETSTSDVIQDVYKLVRFSGKYRSLFAIWIVSDSLELQLGDTDKPLKLLSSWGKLLREYASTRSSTEEVPSLYLRRNVFFPLSTEKMVSDLLTLEFLYADAHRHVLSGYYPCSEEDAIYLAGVTMQIAYGDHNMAVHRSGFLKDKLGEVLPAHMTSSRRRVEFERRVLTKHAEISELNMEESKLLYVHYLKHCWQWPYYGATFYEGNLITKNSKLPSSSPSKLSRKSHVPVSIGINTQGFHIVDQENKVLLQSLGFEGLEWDTSGEKNELVLYRKDHSLKLLLQSKKAVLLVNLTRKMVEQYTATEGAHTNTTSPSAQLH